MVGNIDTLNNNQVTQLLQWLGLVDLEIVLGLVLNALNMGITTTMFNFFYYFPVWDDNFVDKVSGFTFIIEDLIIVLVEHLNSTTGIRKFKVHIKYANASFLKKS